MRILIATIQVPFLRGGAELMAERLIEALIRHGHQAEIVSIPFKWYPPEQILDHMLACRLLDISESCGHKVDRVIGLKFPAYLIPHPDKVLYLAHQHRPAYDLWGSSVENLHDTPGGAAVRDAVRQADSTLIPEASRVFTISKNVSQRLLRFNGIASEPIYHPPEEAGRFYCDESGDYLFYPSRISTIKRQALVLEALAKTREPVRVVFAGSADYPPYLEELGRLSAKLGVSARVEWAGHVSMEKKMELYARCLGVVFPPVDEDYGYVTLEAMLSSKPVLAASDSGGPLEFIRAGENGLVFEPTPAAMATAMDELWRDRPRARRMGEAGRNFYETLNPNWDDVVVKLIG